MKIAFVSTILTHAWGGADTMWTRAAEAASERGDTVLLALSPLVTEHVRIRALQAKGAQLALRPRGDLPSTLQGRLQRRVLKSFGRKDPLTRALDGFEPDLVVISAAGTYDLMSEPELRAWLKTSRTPYHLIANWQSENPELDDDGREIAAAVLAEAREISFVSRRNLAVTRRHLLHPLPNAHWRHNPLAWDGGGILPWPEEKTWRMATVSRLAPGKGLDIVLHAAEEALGHESGWEINIHGAGREENYLRNVIAHLGLTGHARLCGYAADRDDLWRSHHLLLSPSIDDGVPMTIPEAALRGRPVAATAVGGAEDWILPQRTGFLASAATVPLLTRLIREAWSSREQWRTMGKEAAAIARATYRPDDYLQIIRP